MLVGVTDSVLLISIIDRVDHLKAFWKEEGRGRTIVTCGRFLGVHSRRISTVGETRFLYGRWNSQEHAGERSRNVSNKKLPTRILFLECLAHVVDFWKLELILCWTLLLHANILSRPYLSRYHCQRKKICQL